jgi:hypothetical protein
MYLARVVGAVVISFAATAHADDEPPPRPPLVIAPTPPAPTPAPEPRSEFVWSLSFGLGNVDLDQTRSGCDGCTGSPALDTYGAVGRRVTSILAFGAQGQAQVEFVSGHPGDDVRAVVLTGFIYGSLDVTPAFQLVAGAGYGTAQYQYSVQQDGLFGSHSVDMTDHIGSGPAVLGAARYVVSELAHFDFALELRATAVRLDNAGTTPGVSLDLVAGRF